MGFLFSIEGNLLPGGSDPGSGVEFENLSPEAKVVAAKALQAHLEKTEGSRADLEGKISTMGEELSQANAALDGYRRGQSGGGKPISAEPGGNGDGGGDETFEAIKGIDIIENPNGWAKAFMTAVQVGVRGTVAQMVHGLEAGRKVREDFFTTHPELKKASVLVDLTTQQYLQENPQMATPENKNKAFEEIAKRVRKQIVEMGGKIEKEPPPHFESGGDRGGGEQPSPPKPEVPKTVEESQAEELDEFVGTTRKNKAKRM
jgi:hypothetical protein